MDQFEVLTSRERTLHALLGHCMMEFVEVVGDGPTAAIDLAEIRTKIHDLQHRLAGNALARAHPEQFKLLGHQGSEPAPTPPAGAGAPTRTWLRIRWGGFRR